MCWIASYLQTYLERDVRAVTAVRDLATFRRFLALLASRHGQVLNKTDLAAPEEVAQAAAAAREINPGAPLFSVDLTKPLDGALAAELLP